MKYFILAVLVVILYGQAARACDCSLPQNYGNKQCVATITAALKNSKLSTSTATSNASSTSNAVSGSTATATVGPITSSSAQSQKQTQTQGQVANGGAGGAGGSASANSSGGTQENAISSTYETARIPVATAFSAALTSGLDTCLGSSSGGVQTGPLGLTFGSTRRDKTCEFIKKTHLTYSISPVAGCIYMLKNDAGIAAAFREASVTCAEIFAPPPVPTVIHDVVYIQAPADIVAQDCPKPKTSPTAHKRFSCPIAGGAK